MISFFDPKSAAYVSICDANGLSPDIDTFVRSHQEYIKLRFDAMLTEFKYSASTEAANCFIMELNIELYTSIVSNCIKASVGHAYMYAKSQGKDEIAEVRRIVKKMVENPGAKDNSKTLNYAIMCDNNNLRTSFELYN